MTEIVHVAAAAIFDENGRLLITKRPDHVHQGGLWEFPGGKVEAGETIQQALCRELLEELNIVPTNSKPLIRIPFQYPDKTVLLDVWRVLSYTGRAQGMEGQPMRWVSVGQLDRAEFPAANRAIIDALQLPDRYLITGEFADANEFVLRLRKALEAGVRMVQFRVKSMASFEKKALLKESVSLCHEFGALLIVNGDIELALWGDADGVHLTSNQLASMDAPQLQQAIRSRSNMWVGASCHDAAELQNAVDIGVRYVSLSPVLATATHPDTPALGWSLFQQRINEVPLPVFALGGMTVSAIDQVVSLGGQGIAAIREFW